MKGGWKAEEDPLVTDFFEAIVERLIERISVEKKFWEQRKSEGFERNRKIRVRKRVKWKKEKFLSVGIYMGNEIWIWNGGVKADK